MANHVANRLDQPRQVIPAAFDVQSGTSGRTSGFGACRFGMHDGRRRRVERRASFTGHRVLGASEFAPIARRAQTAATLDMTDTRGRVRVHLLGEP